MPEYDNDNRLALWNPKDDHRTGYYEGYGEWDGSKVYEAVLIMRPDPKPSQPVATLWWRTADHAKGEGNCTAIFQGDKGLSGQYGDWWVNVYRNESGPPAVVKFSPKEQAAAKPAPVASGDIPF